ncbi:endoglucanase 12-like [Ananas comosus]|uniref:Endoglucanase n=1 Tax=Ananas comosus TaxID=4615 RepID=A0A199V5T3_ANACO|nr:endoglucanase 12-like [Ananas comosus]XP_020111314.1 endoglucanase 12-like [Ananas comosus]OAY72447.1 Endoglucanase 12 [Ananas comosus]
MYAANHWGGSFEIQVEAEDENSPDLDLDRAALPRQQLDDAQQGWLLEPCGESKKTNNYIDLGCIVCKRKLFNWVLLSSLIACVVTAIPIFVVKMIPKHKELVLLPDEYTEALHKALKFFNAQKSGHLPRSNGIPWRGDCGVNNIQQLPDVKAGLVGGYYDSGKNIKFHFPMAFSMTLLSWSVIEYGHKYDAIGEHDHIRDIIKWGTDYLLRTFNSSASTIDKIYIQVGVAKKDSTTPDDGYCWQRPENINYPQPILSAPSAPDLSSEVASALASASIVFRDDTSYSKKLVEAAETAYQFATKSKEQTPYSFRNELIEPFYNSTGYWDEFIWGAAWLFYATGNYSYLSLATENKLLEKAEGFSNLSSDSSVFSWDNKLPGAELLLARLRIFLNPGYPYEEMLRIYHNATNRNMCSYLRQFNVFNWTRGGLIQLNHGGPRPLQYAAKAAFLASLYADYMNASNIPGWYCGPEYFDSDTLRKFAVSQVNYILGSNPMNMSYVVGHGHNYPRHVHHRGASIPNDGNSYSCTGGWKWRDRKSMNPNTITGAMVAGPDRSDQFFDIRNSENYTEPTLAGNAGLVAALISLTSSGGSSGSDGGIDRNTIFSSMRPFYSNSPPPPFIWKP